MSQDLAKQIRIEDVRQSTNPDLQAEIIRFWTQHGALSAERATERVGEVIQIARHSSGAIVGLITGHLLFVDSMQMTFYTCRGFVSPDARSQGLIILLCRETYFMLNQEYVSGRNQDAVGIFLDIESPLLKARNEAVWSEPENDIAFYYIGQKPNGNHIRIAYFKGAKI